MSTGIDLASRATLGVPVPGVDGGVNVGDMSAVGTLRVSSSIWLSCGGCMGPCMGCSESGPLARNGENEEAADGSSGIICSL